LGFDLKADELSYFSSQHFRSDRDSLPTNQISRALSEPELNGSTSPGIRELADLISKQAYIRVCAKCETNLLLDLGLNVGHAGRLVAAADSGNFAALS